jgi:2-polyprenyl-3-methyl-5-hydroxy-6-metoxy-1,4-benzoquinol methylase
MLTDLSALRSLLRDVAAKNTVSRAKYYSTPNQIERAAFNLSLVLATHDPGSRVCDIGGGFSLFSLGCAALGMKTVLVDDFRDPLSEKNGDAALGADRRLDYHRSLGIEVITRDVVRDGLGLPPESVDVVTVFDSMEHWHASPKRVFSQVREALRPAGTFIVSGPNCVNLRKRITVPLGRGKWSDMTTWYERPEFRGHVREPDVADLLYIGRDLQLLDCRVLGRNWSGYGNGNPVVRTLTPFVDGALRLFPSLCSDIYLIGRKPLRRP